LLPIKDAETTQRLLSYLRHSLLLHRLSPSERSRVVDAMTVRSAHAGEVVVRAGDTRADYFYLVDKGELEVFGKRKNKGGEESVAVLRAGDTFGELALWYGTPRNATVRASTHCILWTVECTKFVELLGYKKHQFEPWVKALEKVQLLKPLMPYELTLVAYAGAVLRVNAGDLLFKEGSFPDSFYVVLSGSVCNRKEGKKKKKKINFVQLAEFSGAQRGKVYSKHDSIGAEALAARKHHEISVKATTFAEVLVLNRSHFTKLVLPHIR
jgi:CRP-like cAMP-binding protein